MAAAWTFDLSHSLSRSFFDSEYLSRANATQDFCHSLQHGVAMWEGAGHVSLGGCGCDPHSGTAFSAGVLLSGGPVHICRLRDHRQEQRPGCPESLRVLGLVQHPPLSPEYPPHGHQQHRAGTERVGPGRQLSVDLVMAQRKTFYFLMGTHG